MLTNASGQSAATYDYSDYGETRQTSGSTALYNPFLYTGQEYDFETSLYHLRARHYSPSLGRFFSRDPIGYAGGPNMMAYCAGDPINWSDPSGCIAFFTVVNQAYQEPFTGDVNVNVSSHWIAAWPFTWFTHPEVAVIVRKFTPNGWKPFLHKEWNFFNSSLPPIIAAIGYTNLPTLVIDGCQLRDAARLQFEFYTSAINEQNERHEDWLTYELPLTH